MTRARRNRSRSIFRSSDRRPEGTGEEVSRFQLQESRRNRSRSIQVPETGVEKEQEQKYSGSSDRRPEGPGAELFRFQ